ncbi:MAG: alpha-glucosidase [Candidatus Odinarchaeota archaeon]
MKKKVVLIGAGSTSFGPSMFSDLYLSKVLDGSTIVLHDIDREKLEIIYELLTTENELKNNKFVIERTVNRKKALKDADFIINSIEVGNRMELWRQDYKIPRNYGSTQVLGENGGPGGIFHSFRIIPPIIEIVKDVEKICPNAFFINFSNPMSRVCLAIKRCTNINFIGLCHEIHSLEHHIPLMFNKKLRDIRMIVAGLNHFGFLLSLEDLNSGKNLLPKFNAKVRDYFKNRENRFEFSALTFKVFEKFGYFPHAGDNHMGEYLQFAEEFTKKQDMIDWIDRTDNENQGVYKRIMRYYKRLKKGRYPRRGMLSRNPSGERAIPIIEALLMDANCYENSVNIPNDNLIENLPRDLVIEVPVRVDKNGVHGIKIGSMPRNITALLRIEATIQDLCVEAILQKSRDLAITALALDPNVGSFKRAEKIFEEMTELQKDYLPTFK